MKTINVSEATNNQLDWLVARCEGATSIRFDGEFWRVLIQETGFSDYEEYLGNLNYTTDPAQMWPIIEREKIVICDWDYNSGIYAAELLKPYSKYAQGQGPTQLVAMARCYVTSKLGETVEVPEEL